VFFADAGMMKSKEGAGRGQESEAALFVRDAGIDEFGEKKTPGGLL
jgi:hypothetical protein